MKRHPAKISRLPLEKRILTIRGEKVILDADLAELYDVPTKRLNEQVKRNADRFPEDFVFQLTKQEAEDVQRSRSQIATASPAPSGMRSQIATASKRNIRYCPNAFTEHGALMAATILNSPRAIQMSVFVIRAFLKMRAALGDTRALAQKLAALEQELKGRLDLHEAAIVDVLQRIMRILEPAPEPPEPPKPEIGFHVKEASVPYRVKRKPVGA